MSSLENTRTISGFEIRKFNEKIKCKRDEVLQDMETESIKYSQAVQTKSGYSNKYPTICEKEYGRADYRHDPIDILKAKMKILAYALNYGASKVYPCFKTLPQWQEPFYDHKKGVVGIAIDQKRCPVAVLQALNDIWIKENTVKDFAPAMKEARWKTPLRLLLRTDDKGALCIYASFDARVDTAIMYVRTDYSKKLLYRATKSDVERGKAHTM